MSRYVTGERDVCRGMLLENTTYVEVCYWRMQHMLRYVDGEQEVCYWRTQHMSRYVTGEHDLCQGMLLENMTYVRYITREYDIC